MTQYTEFSQMPGAGNRIDPGYGPNTGAGRPVHYASMGRQGFGWITFAAIVFLTVGMLNVLDGIVALLRSSYLSNDLPIGDIKAWGWGILILGAVQMILSGAILRGRRWSVFVGIMLSVINLIGQMLFVRTYPVWSLLVIALDVLVIYALAVYGGRGSDASIEAAAAYDVELTAGAAATREPQRAPRT